MRALRRAVLPLSIVLVLASCASNEEPTAIGGDPAAETSLQPDETTTTIATAASPSTTEPTTTSSQSVTSTPAAPPLCGPAAADPVLIGAADQSLGDIRQLQLRIDRSDQDVGAFSLTPIKVEVTEVSETRTSLRWTSEASALMGIEIPAEMEATLGISLDELPTQDIRYWLDDEGFFAGVDNIAQIKEQAIDTLDLVQALFPDDDQRAAIESVYRSLNDEQVTATFAEEVSIYHSFDGLPLEPGLRFEGADTLPNSFGGESFPATATFTIDDAVDDDGCAGVRLVIVPEPEAFARIMWDTLESTFGSAADEAEVIDQFDVRNVIEAVVDPATGTVIEITGSQFISTMGESRESTKTITDVGPTR